METYLFRRFRPIADGMVTVEAGCFQVTLAPEVLQKCEPTDSIFRLSEDTFCLILREMADPNVFSFIGLCKHSRSRGHKLELDTIRYLLDWAWLLSPPGQKEPWWKFTTWTNTQVCWLTLRKHKKLETRLFLQRVVRKAQFLQKMRILAEEAQQALSSHSGDKQQLMDFFKRQWKKTCKRWQQEDEIIVANHEARRALVRKLLPGYKSLEPSPDNTQFPLEQSMWLPVSYYWVGRRSTGQRLLVECVSRNIPLPPLHLATDFRSHDTLSLELGLEKGLRQLQRLAQELSTQDLAAHERALESYKLGLDRRDFKGEEWAIFLHWLSRPTSPSYEMLKHGSRKDVPLIWEAGIETRAQLDEAHNWLDNNFNRYLEALSSSHSSESLLIEIFALIYREQFELLYMFLFHPLSEDIKESHVVPRNELGAQFARCFFWRFERSMKQAYKVLPEWRLPHRETKELWAEFLDWLTQRSFEEQAPEIPSEVYDDRPRSLVDEKKFDTRHGELCLRRMKLEGVLDELKTQATSFELSRLTLPELVQAEIWRRRLPERVFAFLFEDTETTPQPTQSDRNLEEILTHGQSYNCGGPSVQDWRQEIESWKVVEQYISKSEWHISCQVHHSSNEEEEIVII